MTYLKQKTAGSNERQEHVLREVVEILAQYGRWLQQHASKKRSPSPTTA